MLYIQNRADSTLGVIEDFYNDTHQMILSSGVSSYTFTVAKNIEDAEYLVEGNYIVVTDDIGMGWKFTIMNTSQTHTEITVYCEDIGLELVNKVMDAWSEPSSKQPVSYYINKAIKDTKWKIGLNQIDNLSRTLKWEGRDTSLNRLLSICTEFDHAEIEFKVRFRNLQVTDYLINIYKKRGANRSDIQLVYGDTVNDITKTSSIEELATALMGVGSDKELPENSPAEAVADKTTFKDLTYDDGLFFTKAGDKFLRARVANQQFNLKEGYIEDFYEYDTADPQELLNRTITQLKERSEIKVNYEVSVAKFEKTLQLGDTITIIDHDYKPELLLSGRVLEMDKSYTDPSNNTLVLGNFLILYSNINDRLTNLQNQIKNMKLDSNYMWLRYAIDDKGNGMSATPTAETKYFAMLVNKKTGIPSDNPADYAGHWKLIQGADGKDGIPGATGADGKTSYTHFAYANNVSGTTDFSLDDPTGRSYMGVYSDFTKADSNDPSDYVWSLTKGESGPEGMQGAQGPKGDIGIPGKPGADGKTSYTHVAYADNDNGGGFGQNPTNKAYMGWYSDFTANDSTDTTKYAWSLIKGRDGSDGAPGKAGTDGKTPYFHQAWADSKDGKINFSTTDPTNRGYLGTYSDFTQADSTDPSKYFWVELVGNLQVGVRNLLNGTADFSNGLNVSGANGTVITDEVYNGNRVLKEPQLTASNSYHDPYVSNTIDVAKGEYYALSFYAKTDAPSMVMRCYFYNPTNTISSINSQGFESASADGMSTFTITNQWKQYWVVWKTNINTTVKKVIIGRREKSVAGSDAGAIFINSPMLVEGNKAVGWQPAPEDTQGQIDSVNQALVQANNKINAVPHVSAQSSAPTSPKEGDQWWVLDASGKATGFKVWNGSAWNDSKIQQSLLNVVSLNAVTITGSTINGSKFTNNFDFTNADKIRFQGVTTIGDGAINITWKIPTNNQTGQILLNASGFQSVVNDSAGAIINRTDLLFGELDLMNRTSGTGTASKYVSGSLTAQDVYRGDTTAVQWLSGWGDWGNGNGLIHVTRNGYTVSVSGYPHHNNSANFAEVATLPAWARPPKTVNLSGTIYDSGVMNPAACKITIDQNGKVQVTNGKKGGYLIIGGTYVGQDIV